MRKLLKLIAVSAALGAAFPAAAAPTLLVSSDAASYSGPVLNLTGYDYLANGNYSYGSNLPGGITFAAHPGPSVIGPAPFTYGLGGPPGNGSLGGTATYIGVGSVTGYAELSSPLRKFAHVFFRPRVSTAEFVRSVSACER